LFNYKQAAALKWTEAVALIREPLLQIQFARMFALIVREGIIPKEPDAAGN
jgi:hypothetical protein